MNVMRRCYTQDWHDASAFQVARCGKQSVCHSNETTTQMRIDVLMAAFY